MSQEYSQHSNNYAHQDMDYEEGNIFSTKHNPLEIHFQFYSDDLPDEFGRYAINSQVLNLGQEQDIDSPSIIYNSNEFISDFQNSPYQSRQEENLNAMELQSYKAQSSQRSLDQDNGDVRTQKKREDKLVKKVAKMKKKNDQKKNVYGNSFLLVAKTLFSKKYQSFFKHLCQKYETKVTQVKAFYGKLFNISLSDVRDLLNFKKNKGVLLQFLYLVFEGSLLHPHTQIKKIKNKQAYFEAKNYLVYISDLIKDEISHKDEE